MTTSVQAGLTHFEGLNAVALEYQGVSVYHWTWVDRVRSRRFVDLRDQLLWLRAHPQQQLSQQDVLDTDYYAQKMRRARADAIAAAAAVAVVPVSEPILAPEEVDMVEEVLAVDPVEIDLAVEVPVEEEEKVEEETVEEVCAVDPVEVSERELVEVPDEMMEDRVAAKDLSALVLADSGVNMSDSHVPMPVVEYCGASPLTEKKDVDAELKKQLKKWSVSKVMSGVKRAVARFLPRRNHRVHVA
ncbi:hypothetical protein GGF32_009035 [Allomyces javanicus]|nr:hypothetical protein GGF32_009035 [Allomyces javanicus]